MHVSADERFLTLQEVADRLQVSYRSVYRWVHEDKLPAYQIETQWRVTEADLEEFLEQRKKR